MGNPNSDLPTENAPLPLLKPKPLVVAAAHPSDLCNAPIVTNMMQPVLQPTSIGSHVTSVVWAGRRGPEGNTRKMAWKTVTKAVFQPAPPTEAGDLAAKISRSIRMLQYREILQSYNQR